MSAETSKNGEQRMDDKELDRLLKKADREFHALYRRMAWLGGSRVSDFAFTQAEKKAWSRGEPNFPRRIVESIRSESL